MHDSTLIGNCSSVRQMAWLKAIFFATVVAFTPGYAESVGVAQDKSQARTPELSNDPAANSVSPPIADANFLTDAVPIESPQNYPKVCVGLTQSFEDDLHFKERELLLTRQCLKRRSEIQNVSLEQYENAWKMNLQVNNLPASTALENLSAELGIPFAADPEVAKLLVRNVTLNHQGCSRLQAIEEICSAVGVYPDYSELESGDEGSLPGAFALLICPPQAGLKPQAPPPITYNPVRLRKGPRPFPIAFSGPTAVEICGLEEFAPYAVGKLHVRVLTAGLPGSVAAYQDMRKKIDVEFAVVEDQQRNPLVDEDNFHRPWLDEAKIQSQTHSWNINNLLRQAETLHVRGRVRIQIPHQVQTLRLDKLTKGAVTSVGDWRMRFESSRKSEELWISEDQELYNLSMFLTGRDDDTAKLDQQLVIFDAQGHALKSENMNYWSESISYNGKQLKELHGEVTVEGKPASMLLKVFDQVGSLDYPFELKMPLKYAPLQPAKLMPLKFPGAAPVSLEVLAFQRTATFPKVKIRLTNHSNKEVHCVSYTLNYLDATGKHLGDSVGSLGGGVTMTGAPKDGIAPVTSTESEATAFFVPIGTTSVTLALSKVTMMDATEWNAPVVEKFFKRPRLLDAPGDP